MVAVPVPVSVPRLRHDAISRVGRHQRLQAFEHDQDVFVPVFSGETEDHVHEGHLIVLQPDLYFILFYFILVGGREVGRGS